MAMVPYGMLNIPLTTAGQTEFSFDADFWAFADAQNADGSQNLSALIEVKFGKDNSDQWVPFRINNAFDGKADKIAVRWAAQAGITAKLFHSRTARDDQGGMQKLRLITPPPRQLVTSAVGTTLQHAGVTVTTSPTLISAANAARQSLMLQNNSGTYLYLGGSSVSVSNGLYIAPYQIITLDKTTAAVYGIVSGGTANVRVLEEI